MSKIHKFDEIAKSYFDFTEDSGGLEAVFMTGTFEAIFDYGRGYVNLKVYIEYGYKEEEQEQLIMSISTIDDGVWQAYRSKKLTIEEGQLLCKELKEEFGNILPSEDGLNAFLRKFGAYGLYTG